MRIIPLVAILTLSTGIPLGIAVPTDAQEARCGEVGANCVCSEPMNAATMTHTPPYYAVNDGGTKKCAVENQAGKVIARWDADLFESNDATTLAKLPAGHRVSRFVRGADGHVGIYWVGSSLSSLGSQYVKRTAMRWYVYYSPNFEFAYTNQCQNHKNFETENMVTTMRGTDSAGSGDGAHSIYGWLAGGWNRKLDCCFAGPNSVNYFGPSFDTYRGSWIRFEAIVTNRAGGGSPNGFRFQMYQKNVTTNGPDELVLDTAGKFYSGLDAWGAWTDLTPSARQDWFTFAGYRQNVCAGYYGFSHLMIAGWDTDSAQRIGAASEIEGGGTPSPSPSAPSQLNLR